MSSYYCEFCGVSVSPEYEFVNEEAQGKRYCQECWESTQEELEHEDKTFWRYLKGRR